MKVLHLPLNVPGSEQIGQSRGMREVFDEVVEFDYLNYSGDVNAKLVEISKQGFDIAWMQLQETNIIQPSTLIDIKNNIKLLTQWNGDIRRDIPSYQQLISPLFDITYLGFDHLKEYNYGDTRLMMIAVDPEEVKVSPQQKEYEVVFIGNHYGNQFPDSELRLELVRLLKGRFNTKVLGFGWPEGLSDGMCPVKEQSQWYTKGKTCISINHFNDIKYYSERLLWCLASGTPTIVKRTPNLEFKENEHYLGFDDVNECVRQIELVLQYPERFDKMGKLASNEVIKKHNWTERFKQLKKDYECLKK